MSSTRLHSLAEAVATLGIGPARRRLLLSRAKHPSLGGHSRWARRLARLVPGYGLDGPGALAADGAPSEVVAQRGLALERLSTALMGSAPRTLALTERASESLSDLQFTRRYRVPFPFAALASEQLRTGGFLESSDGLAVTDLDGNRFFDLTGSYGVNLFGTDFYRECIDEAVERARALGPILGSLHPCVLDNAERLKRISGLDEVSFHMSGTEAVMQAARLARYHTGRRYLVRFCGAYHGWWEDVQPGPGNPLPPRDTFTLRDMDERSLRVLATRRDIACVLVNPLQALHPNASAPSDSQLVDGSRRAHFDRNRYATWLRQLREVCSARGIVLILDEVFVGFRLAPGGAQSYFDVKADLVTYGKTLGGGLPVGVVCGRRDLMKRFREDRPADICLARGTFNAHPYVMAAMAAFLHRMERPEVLALYDGLDDRWDGRAKALNSRLDAADVPVRVANLSTIWTVNYTRPGRYHWLLQYYLRRHSLALSWVGTGRLIFSLGYRDADFDAVADRFVAACTEMKTDGWWWHDHRLTRRAIRYRVAREMLRARFGSPHEPAG